MEKAILRSPEISLESKSLYISNLSSVELFIAISKFFVAFSHPLEGDLFRKLLTPILNNSRSTNTLTRASAVQLFSAIVAKTEEKADLDLAVSELFSLPTSGKTAGADHRVALYTMLGFVKPSVHISQKVVQLGIPLLSKETHDSAVRILAVALGSHLLQCLKDGITIAKDTAAAIAKEMISTKPSVRRAFCSLVGNALWQLSNLSTESSFSFAQSILSSFEVNLKTVSANPLGAPAGPLEGYIAVAILLGPYSRNGRFGELIDLRRFLLSLTFRPADVLAQNVVLQSLLNTGAKPSFILWDKVYQKLTDVEDEVWLLRASEQTFRFYGAQLNQNAQAWSVSFTLPSKACTDPNLARCLVWSFFTSPLMDPPQNSAAL